MNCVLSSPSIEDNEIADNRATAGGAGIFAWFCSATIRDNIIAQNEVTDPRGSGGGVFLDHFSAATVADNLIRGNRAGAQGGGIYVDSSAPFIVGNIIQGNQADANAGVCSFLESSPTLVNNIIANNVSGGGAGGMGVDFLCSPQIMHNTIVNNSSPGPCSELFVRSRSTVYLTNTILWDQGRSLYVEEPGSRVIATHSNIRGGFPGQDNISADPLFVEPVSGDYRLLFRSPCIDTGLDTNVDTDFEGDLRPFDGDGDGIARYDMGADEWVGAIYQAYLPLTFRTVGP